jgi:hypothetical protein
MVMFDLDLAVGASKFTAFDTILQMAGCPA